MERTDAITPARSGARAGDAGYQLLFERNPLPIWVYDAESLRFLAVNDSAVRHYGYSRDRFAAMTVEELFVEDERNRLRTLLEQLDAGNVQVARHWRHRCSDGRTIDVELTSEDLPFSGRRARLVLANDVTEARRSEAELARRTAKQLAIADLGRAGLDGASLSELMDLAVRTVAEHLEADLCELLVPSEERDSLVLRAGHGWGDGLVRSARVPLGSEFHAGFAWGSLGEVVIRDYATETRFRPSPLLVRHGAVSGMCVVVGAAGHPFAVLGAHSTSPREFAPEEVGFLHTIANLLAEAAARHRADAEIRHKALHDPLTGLPNRTLLLERFDRWLARAARTDATAAVLFVDVDDFKLVNDGLGHAVGDQLLLGLASRLARSVRPSDTVARVGGDEFVILCEDTPSEREALEIVSRVMNALAVPFPLAGRDHHVSASVGITIAGARSEAATAIQDADAAMYRAKELGGARFELFDAEMRNRSVRRLETERELRAGLERGEFRNAYQPLVSGSGTGIMGFEALLRWEHPEHGTVAPLEFIPIAEDTGLIIPIGLGVLERACRDAVSWDELAGRELSISVNLSPRQVTDPGLVDSVERILEQTGLAPHRLSLEITETAIINDADATGLALARLKRLGVDLVLDDFGTGYSSLSHAKHFPIDALKIDRSFVSGLGYDAEDSAIVSAVISMGRALGLDVVAEGVETAEQAHHLRTLGCPLVQGYHFARPLAADGVPELLAGER